MKTPQAKPGHLKNGGPLFTAHTDKTRAALSAAQKARYAPKPVVFLGWKRNGTS